MTDFAWYDEEASMTRSEDPAALLNAALGLAGEVGEVIELIKKERFHGVLANTHTLRKELGDVLFYLSWVANLYGVSLSSVAQTNIQKLRERYPNGFVSGGGIR